MMNRLSRLFVIFFLLFVPSLIFAQSYSYSKRNGQVYYDGKVINGADSHSFRDLGYGYGKDRNHVYRYGTILEYVDPSSFRVDRRFSADNRPSSGIIAKDRDIMYQLSMYSTMVKKSQELQAAVL